MEIAELVLKYVEALVWPLVTVALVWGLRAHIKEAFRRLTRLETPAGSMEFAEEARELLDEAERLAIPRPHRPSEALTPPDPGPATTSDTPLPPPFHTPGGPAGPVQPQPDPEPRMPRWVYADEAEGVPEPPPNPWAGESDERDRTMRMRPRRRSDGVLLRELFAEATTMASASPVGAVITAWTTLEGFCVDILRQRDVQVDRSSSGAHNSRQLMNGLRDLGLSPVSEEVFFRLRRLRNTAVHQPDSVTPEAARDFAHSCRSLASDLLRYDRALGAGPPNRGSRTPPGDVGGRV